MFQIPEAYQPDSWSYLCGREFLKIDGNIISVLVLRFRVCRGLGIASVGEYLVIE